jgi:hypothetical protein
MNTTSIPTVPTPPQWGERIIPVGKRLAYVFSLDLTLGLTSSPGPTARRGREAALRNPDSSNGSEGGFTYHVLDEVLVTTVDGVVRDVPRGRVVRADDVLIVDAEGIACLDGRLLLELDADVRATLSIAYTGVVTVPGGANRIFQWDERPLHGAAFTSIRSECELSKFRWMVESQLFGFGRLRVRDANGQIAQCTLDFSYDIYSAG